MRSARWSRRAPRGRASASTSTSSSRSDAPATVAVARVARPQGIRGELACDLLTDFPERFAEVGELLVGRPPRPYRLERYRVDRRRVFLKLAGIDDRDAAEALRGAEIHVLAAEAVALPEGSYYWHQIVGLRVEAADGRDLGTIAEIIPTGSNEVYVVRRPAGGELLLPAIKDVVQDVDLERGVVVVHLLPGLES